MPEQRVIDKIIERMPVMLDTEGEMFRAIWGRTQYTPQPTIVESDDFNCGAIVNEIELLRTFLRYITRTDDVADFSFPYLDEIVEFFVNLERLFEETDESLVARLYSLIRRNGNQSWMTPHMVRDVFSYYVNRNNVYVVEFDFPVADDLITNGDFEIDLSGSDWQTSGTNDYHLGFQGGGRSFIGGRSINLFALGASTDEVVIESQVTITVAQDTLHTYYVMVFPVSADRGDDTVDIESVVYTGTEWFDESDFSWKSNPITGAKVHSVPVGRWSAIQGFFDPGTRTSVGLRLYLKSGASTPSREVYVDLARMGERGTHPRFRVFLVSDGQSAGSVTLWPDGADPIGGGADYDFATFFGSAFIGGESGATSTPDELRDILDKIKTAGSEAILEISTRATYTRFDNENSIEDLRIVALDMDGDLVNNAIADITFAGTNIAYTTGLYSAQSAVLSGTNSKITDNETGNLTAAVAGEGFSSEIVFKTPATLPATVRSILSMRHSSGYIEIGVSDSGLWTVNNNGTSTTHGTVAGDTEYSLVILYEAGSFWAYVNGVLLTSGATAATSMQYVDVGNGPTMDALQNAIVGRLNVWARKLDSDEVSVLSNHLGD